MSSTNNQHNDQLSNNQHPLYNVCQSLISQIVAQPTTRSSLVLSDQVLLQLAAICPGEAIAALACLDTYSFLCLLPSPTYTTNKLVILSKSSALDTLETVVPTLPVEIAGTTLKAYIHPTLQQQLQQSSIQQDVITTDSIFCFLDGSYCTCNGFTDIVLQQQLSNCIRTATTSIMCPHILASRLAVQIGKMNRRIASIRLYTDCLASYILPP